MFDLDYCMKGAPAELKKEILAAYNQIFAEDREELLQMKRDTNYLNNSNEEENEINQLIQTIDTLLETKYQANQLETGLLHKEAPFFNQENQLVDLQKIPQYSCRPQKTRKLHAAKRHLRPQLFIDNMKQYINQFEKIFSTNEMKEIIETNPKRFLGMDN